MAGQIAMLEIHSSEPPQKVRAGKDHVGHTYEFPHEIELHYRALISPAALFWTGHITKP